MPEDKYQKMREVRDEVINCTKCPLYKTRITPVVGEGSHEAKIMFVGEAPGANEDRTGRPFCGRAGDILDGLLESAGMLREKVYITNILKSRPPDNRDPHKKEVEACTLYLEKQIDIIKPKVVCPLGRHAMYYLMKKYGLENQIEPISRIHGQEFKAATLLGSIAIVPLYHPAVATYNSNMKPVLEKDFRILKKYYEED